MSSEHLDDARYVRCSDGNGHRNNYLTPTERYGRMSDDDHSPVVRVIAAVEELDGMYQILVGFSLFVGLGFVGFGLPILGILWLLGGPALVFAVQRWED